MADVHSKEVRSYNMSRIKGKDTKPEMLLRKLLHGRGFRFRLHVKNLPGKPDIVLPKYKTAIQVHGCFWHGHEHCKDFKIPGTRTDWWTEKIAGNKENDRKKKRLLENEGWSVLEIYACELKKDKQEETIDKLVNNIKAGAYDRTNKNSKRRGSIRKATGC